MIKALLVIDKMPENCMECPLRFKDGDTDDWFRFRCHMSTDQIPKEGKLNNCELKSLPQKKEDLNLDDWVTGFNDCIDEILGGDYSE